MKMTEIVVNAMAADDLADMFKEGKISGQVREFTISREVEDTRPDSGNVKSNQDSFYPRGNGAILSGCNAQHTPRLFATRRNLYAASERTGCRVCRSTEK